MAEKKQKSTGLLAFLRSVKVELNKVNWPDRQQTWRLTLVVLGVSIVIGAYIGGLDFLFTKLIASLITK